MDFLRRRGFAGESDLRGRSVAVLSPATGEPFSEFERPGPEAVDAALTAAAAAAPDWSRTQFPRRAELLRALQSSIVSHAEALAEAIAREQGKPVAEALASEVIPLLGAIEFLRAEGAAILSERRLPPRQFTFRHREASLRREALGVVAIVTPWNYPLAIPAIEVVQALAAGNAVVLKPATAGTLVALAFADLVRAAGFPPGVFNVAPLCAADTELLVADRRVAKVLFTGSVATGRRVASLAAGAGIPSVLELGGKNAAVVLSDADVEVAARGIVWAAFANCGQTCAAISRVFVEAELAPRLVDALAAHVASLRVGDPLAQDTDLGPLTTAAQRDAVRRHERVARLRARRVIAGSAPGGAGFWQAPTLAIDVSTSAAPELREETFGPLLVVNAVADEAAAIAAANDTEFGLAASVWTSDASRAERFAREVRAGAIGVNCHLDTFAEPTAPWGGFGASGYGRTHGEIGLLELTAAKYVSRDRASRGADAWWFPLGGPARSLFAATARALYGAGSDRLRAAAVLGRMPRFRERIGIAGVLRALFRRRGSDPRP